MTTTLTEFLLARIAEDEAAARHAGADAMTGARWKHWSKDAYDEIQTVTLDRCRRVLAECEAKDAVVTIADVCTTYVEGAALHQFNRILWMLAKPYAGHVDFNESWRP